MSDDRPLKPCPFCGRQPHVSHRTDEDLWTHNQVVWTTVECLDCDVRFSWPPGAEPDAIDQWNTRVEAPGAHGQVGQSEPDGERVSEANQPE